MTIEKERVDETQCEDEFEDAVEATELTEELAEEFINQPIATCDVPANTQNEQNTSNVSSLDCALEEIHHCLVIALDNHFEEALKITQQKSEFSIYHSVGQTFLYFLKGVLTLEKDQVEKALNSATHLFELCSKERRPNYLGVIWRPNYNNYSDIEVHSELCYAESLLMVALLTFLENQNLINLVKGAFRIRSCYAAYKECLNILNTKTNWESERSRRDFEAGVRMGVGTFNLMVSHLPSKVLKVLEYIGFSGNRSTGLQEIEISVSMTDCLRSPISALISATYHCYIEHYFGLGDGDVDYVDKMLAGWLKHYPNSAFFLLFKGRIAVLKGEITDACVSFEKCINIQAEWKQLHNICIWELLWCYCIQCDWPNAIKYADILRKQCAWSPAIYCYQSAIFMHMMMDETGDERLREKINELYKEVPKLRIRYAGKTIPAEKFAITHAEKYFIAGEHLLLPAIEYIYIWNLFAIIEKDKRLVTPILDRVEKKIGQYKNESESDQLSTDNICLLMLLKGVCLRTLGYPYQALESLQQVLKHEKQISLSTWIPPHTSMEMGLTYIRLNEFELSNYWFEKAKKDYSGYLLETLLHFRVHCGQRLIKKAKKKQAEIEASLEIKAALELQQKQQVKIINEQQGVVIAEEVKEQKQVSQTNQVNQVKQVNQVNNLRNGSAPEETAAPVDDEKLKQIIKLKSKLNESLKIDDKYIEYLNEAVEVSSNNL